MRFTGSIACRAKICARSGRVIGMRLIHFACASPLLIDGTTNVTLPAVPSRADLRFLDEAARELLPVDPTPSLDEIAASPSVAHMHY